MDSAKRIREIEIALRHACYPVNLLHIFRTLFLRNTCEWLLLDSGKRLSNISLILEIFKKLLRRSLYVSEVVSGCSCSLLPVP